MLVDKCRCHSKTKNAFLSRCVRLKKRCVNKQIRLWWIPLKNWVARNEIDEKFTCYHPFVSFFPPLPILQEKFLSLSSLVKNFLETSSNMSREQMSDFLTLEDLFPPSTLKKQPNFSDKVRSFAQQDTVKLLKFA